MQRLIAVVISTITLFISTDLLAQDALLRVQERAKYLSDFKALLEHEDPMMRQAAIEEALNGGDAQIRSMALETAFSSDDEMLHTSAIRWYLSERSEIPVTLTRPERPDAGQIYMLDTYANFILTRIEVNELDEITFRAPGAKGGQLIRGGVELRLVPYSGIGCTMILRPASGTTLAGQFACNFGPYKDKYVDTTALIARIDLS